MEVQQRMSRGPQVEARLLLLAFGDERRGDEAGGRTRCSRERRRGTWRRGRPEAAAGGARGGRRRVAGDGVARARAMQGGSWATGTTCGGSDEWRGGGGAGRRGHGRSKPGMATRLDGGRAPGWARLEVGMVLRLWTRRRLGAGESSKPWRVRAEGSSFPSLDACVCVTAQGGTRGRDGIGPWERSG